MFVVALRRRPERLPVLMLAFVLTSRARAQVSFPAGVVATPAAEAGVAYDDNALLGRRGQFLSSATGGQTSDIAARQAIELELDRAFGSGRQLRVAGRLDLTHLRTQSELAGYDVESRASFDARIGDDGTVAPEIAFALHREDEPWSSRTLVPGLRTRYFFPFGVMADLLYRYSIADFARYADGLAQAKASYTNVDREEHTAVLDLRLWPHPKARAQLLVDFRAARFSGNINDNLADYARLEPGEIRRDWGGGSTASVLFTPWRWAHLSGGVRCEINRSNSAPYTFNACGSLADALITFLDRFSLYTSFGYTRSDFPEEHFDLRYRNTKRDFARDLAVRARLALTEELTATAWWRQISNDSNDCSDFDPERTESGLPVNSRSYSCYAQNRIGAFLRYQPGE